MPNPNLEMLRMAVINLAHLVDKFVFVGGCTTGLFITDAGAGEVRITKDVDTIVEATTYAEYIILSEKLKEIGFGVDTRPDAPLCRWIKGETVLDVMPINGEILGFTNSWYKAAIENAVEIEILPKKQIRIVSPPYFCATKLEAFEGRGNGDFLAGHDLEDLITVVDGRIELIEEIKQSSIELRDYISGRFVSFLGNRQFLDALPGLLYPDEESQGRLGILIKRLREIADLNSSKIL